MKISAAISTYLQLDVIRQTRRDPIKIEIEVFSPLPTSSYRQYADQG